ncbi:hypothetical protein DL89DRAFT_171766 [Linderina pennispora]|uniref:Uncharacterized protein n=1 Tax=Linderina pennispora TaxID=61395 RepID=A0A1Y1W6D5_9FUNG|nr:uncharacterized protein DL89DRAFT_171766 [Linderina pennispora]ORX69103.1 hypothetical protein DL89DRAFT_171766 [Linderina pennispora]
MHASIEGSVTTASKGLLGISPSLLPREALSGISCQLPSACSTRTHNSELLALLGASLDRRVFSSRLLFTNHSLQSSTCFLFLGSGT